MPLQGLLFIIGCNFMKIKALLDVLPKKCNMKKLLYLLTVFLFFSFSVIAQSKNEIAIQGGINFKKGEIFSAEYNRLIDCKLKHALGGSIDYLKLDNNSLLPGISFEPMALLLCPYYEYKIISNKFSWAVRMGVALGYSDYRKMEEIIVDKDFTYGGVIQTHVDYYFNDQWGIKLYLKEFLLHSGHLDSSNTFVLIGIGYKF